MRRGGEFELFFITNWVGFLNVNVVVLFLLSDVNVVVFFLLSNVIVVLLFLLCNEYYY